MANKVYLAVDLGAGSGRLMAAVFDSKTIQLEEVSRWASAPVKVGNSYHWDVQAIFNEIVISVSNSEVDLPQQAENLKSLDDIGTRYKELEKKFS
ncbi:MAG: hypothetical protein IKC88_02540, partial [Opitutales bacterium]|nr:hypothetical protein [Opitutales bacterium]